MGHPPASLAVLLSGRGRTLDNLLDHSASGGLPARIVLALASSECPGAELARRRGVPTLIERGDLAPDRFDLLMADAGVTHVVLAGYLRLVPVGERWRNRIVNIHPALLPGFGGRGMYGLHVHRAVLEAGCRVSGATVHLCDERYDTGPILAQEACIVEPDDTPETLAARVFEIEKRIYPPAIRALVEGRVSIDGRRARIIPA